LEEQVKDSAVVGDGGADVVAIDERERFLFVDDPVATRARGSFGVGD
jgi:hypothetical protein